VSPAGQQVRSPLTHTPVHPRRYEQLKTSLESRGYVFHSTSDSELVLYLYQEYGQDFLQHLRGEFSLIVYDSAKQIVIAARDRYGIKPLFWTITKEGRILIGAEMKSFLGLGLEPEFDVKSLRECGWLYDTRTILKGVNRLRPGHMMVFGLDGKLESRPYWEPSYPDKNVRDDRTFEEMVQGVRTRLIDSVACRLRADVPVGVYLSGGIDSSVVAGIITHLLKSGKTTAGSQSSSKLKCFTIEFDAGGAHNEVEIAKRTADFLSVDFNPMKASEKDLVDNFERAVWAIEQPANDLNFVGKYMLSRFVSGQGYPVVLTGEGADEHFA
jgi:asparagine synthase (glutamine-hydrolysing)